MAKLLIQENSGIREFEIVDEEIRIGRELDNNLRIADPSVSRHHAILRRTPAGYVIQDNESVNGISYNGEKVKEAVLMDGDQFSLGQIKITFFQNSDNIESSYVYFSNPPNNGFNTSQSQGDNMSHEENTTPNMISKPDANPILALILTWFVFGLGHMIVNGQTRKWGFTTLATIIGIPLCCFGFVISILSIIDSYQTAVRLKDGETIPENEYSMPLLYKIVRIIDKTATCARAESEQDSK